MSGMLQFALHTVLLLLTIISCWTVSRRSIVGDGGTSDDVAYTTPMMKD